MKLACALTVVSLLAQMTMCAGTSMAGELPAVTAYRKATGAWYRTTGHVTGRLLIQTAAGADVDSVIGDAKRRLGVTRARRRDIRGVNITVLDIPLSAMEHIRAALAGDSRVRFVERDRIVRPAFVPRDTYYEDQYHLRAIGVIDAWDVTTGSAAAPIAVLDSGVDASHPDLVDRIMPGRNVFDDNDDTRDVTGHGTLVAGAVAASTDNGIGVSGVTWLNPIMPVRITDRHGNASYSTIIEGLVWAADQGARIANVSFGVYGARALSAAAEYFVNRGGLVFAAGGNDGKHHDEPANDWIISVAATGPDGNGVAFSSAGDYIDLAAPGVDILSTARGGGYARVSGTSLASPVAAGVAALIFAANPTLSPVQVEDLLKAHTHDLGVPGRDAEHGWGRIEAGPAVRAAVQMGESEDLVSPVAVIVSPNPGEKVRNQVTVAVETGDNASGVRVVLYADGAPIARSTNAPHTFVLDTTEMPNGRFQLLARVRDAAGNIGESEPVSIVVANDPDTAAPRVRFRSARARAVSGMVIPIVVQARDDVAVTGIKLYINGSLVAAKGGPSVRGLRTTWDTRGRTAGTYVFRAFATDAADNLGSAQMKVVVGQSGAGSALTRSLDGLRHRAGESEEIVDLLAVEADTVRTSNRFPGL